LPIELHWKKKSYSNGSGRSTLTTKLPRDDFCLD
jgi:hypothetical protein